NLALIFGTLLSSQGTDASFRPFSPGPPGFPFGLAFPTLPDRFPIPFPDLDSDRAADWRSLLTFAFRRFRLYQILSGLIPGRNSGFVFPAARAVPTSETLAESFLRR
ncbi:hypothetical protein AB0G74_33695, partial [Streptomyces sp. NPDC020875]|uniref:hypothetical protein n=1 Tax=Streptomyces sp. NPDC020875 TaxID=3154898 RepID=UPI0033D79A4E